MSTRTSIVLHPTGARLVEVQVPKRGLATDDVRVTAFISALPPLTNVAAWSKIRIEKVLSKQATVTIWGLRSAHQFLRLPPAKAGDLEALARREARKDIAPLESDGDQACLGLTIGEEVQVGPHRRREVSMIAVSSADVRRQIQPIIEAGFSVDCVLTPALALCAVARAQRDVAAGTPAVYVALTARATCLAIIRNGLVLFSREMPWGHGTEDPEAVETDPVAAIATRLSAELRRSVLFFKQTFRAPVEHVILCGDMPNLRALTGTLGTSLQVSVQTLDSMVGIDAVALPEPHDRFREEIAALRLAIAAGAEPTPSANLLPANIRNTRASQARMTRLAAAVAASVVFVAGGYVLAGRASTRYALERREIENQLAQLEPEAIRRDALRQAAALAISQKTALEAFGSQGPRLSRFLESVSHSVPDEIVLNSLAAEAAGDKWQATMHGVALTPDAATGQAAVNGMLRSLSESPFAGIPADPPALRVVSGRGSVTGAAASSQGLVVPEGMSGVEFTLKLELAK